MKGERGSPRPAGKGLRIVTSQKNEGITGETEGNLSKKEEKQKGSVEEAKRLESWVDKGVLENCPGECSRPVKMRHGREKVRGLYVAQVISGLGRGSSKGKDWSLP